MFVAHLGYHGYWHSRSIETDCTILILIRKELDSATGRVSSNPESCLYIPTVPKGPPSQLLACVRARDDAQVGMRLGASGYTRNCSISEPALRKGVIIIYCCRARKSQKIAVAF